MARNLRHSMDQVGIQGQNDEGRDLDGPGVVEIHEPEVFREGPWTAESPLTGGEDILVETTLLCT